MKVRIASQWREIRTAQAYIDGAWRTLTIGKAYIGGSWRGMANFVQAFSLSAGDAHGKAESEVITTNKVTASPSGGLEPFSYAWTVQSVSGASSITVNSPTSAGTTFTVSGVAIGTQATGTARCTATDSLGSTASTTISITASNIEGLDTGTN